MKPCRFRGKTKVMKDSFMTFGTVSFDKWDPKPLRNPIEKPNCGSSRNQVRAPCCAATSAGAVETVSFKKRIWQKRRSRWLETGMEASFLLSLARTQEGRRTTNSSFGSVQSKPSPESRRSRSVSSSKTAPPPTHIHIHNPIHTQGQATLGCRGKHRNAQRGRGVAEAVSNELLKMCMSWASPIIDSSCPGW